MIGITAEAFKALMDKVSEGYEVHIRLTQDEIEVEVMPWKPFEMKCPYGKGEQE